MTFADHFSEVATRYAAFRPRYPAALIEALAADTAAGPVELAWDVGCGSGQLSVPLADALARRGGRVIATDPAAAQLAAAEPHPAVAYRQAPAEASGLADGAATLVVAAQAAHWFRWPRFLAEVARVARPGARVALVAYSGARIVDEPAATAVLDHYHHVTCAPHWPPERHHVESGYRDLAWPWPAEPVPPAAATLTATWTRAELLGYVSTWSASARLVASAGPAALAALDRDLAAAWPDAAPRTIAWPLVIKLARR